MNWDDLRLFIDLARSGTLTETARRLGVDHSTVGRRVRQLEESLGLKLFDRLARGYTLTAEGEGLLERAEAVETAVWSIHRLAQGQDPAHNGTVVVSAPPAFSSHFLTPRLSGFHTAHPGILLELMGETHAAHLHRREADIALRLSPPDEDGLVARRVGQMGFGLYASPDYTAVTPSPADWRFLGYGAALDHVPQQRWLHHQAGGRPLVFRANDLTILAAATRAGMGVAALPHFIAAGDPGLCPLPTVDAAPVRGLWLVVHDDIRRSPRVRAVMNTLGTVIEQGKAALEGPRQPERAPS